MELALLFLSKNLKILFLFFTVAFFFLLFFSVGMSIWLFVFLLSCVLLFFFLFVFRGGLELTMFVTILVFLFPVIFGSVLFFVSPQEKKVEQKMTAEECKPIYEKYNGKVLDIKGENLIGRMNIEINSEDCKATVSHIFQFSASLPKNNLPEMGNPYWGYFAEYGSGDDRSNWSGRGEIFPAYNNIGTLPEFGVEAHDFYEDESKRGSESTNFYHWYSSIYTFSESEYQNLFQKTRYTIIDGRNFIEEEKTGDGSSSQSLNTKAAGPVAPIAKEFRVEVSER